MKVLALIPIKDNTKEVLAPWENQIELVPVADYLANPENHQDIEVALGNHDILENLEALPKNLKWIQTGSAGYDNLPIEELEARGITVSNGSGIHAKGMAESVFAMILAETRFVRQSQLQEAEKYWYTNRHLSQLDGKEMLIVGAGKVGEEVAHLAKAFGMKVVGVRTKAILKPDFDEMVTTENWDQALATADIIVNILPGQSGKEVYNLELFNKMKRGVFFINVGRGNAVVNEDLLAAVSDQQVSIAALDVTNPEPLPADSPLWRHPRIHIYPHVAGATEDYYRKVWALFAKQINAYSHGEELVNQVTDTTLNLSL